MGRRKEQLFYDFDNGYLYRRDKKHKTYKRVGNKNQYGYLHFQFNGKSTLIHRHLYQLYHKVKLEEGQVINHKNHKRDDNRIKNLEVVTHQENCQWVKKHKDNTSGFKGITWNEKSKKWRADICLNGKKKYLGVFDDINDAKQAYNNKARELNTRGYKYYIED